jgi:prevent-host-death family protein
MTRVYSIAEARQNLSRLLNEVEAGLSVHLTRRGRPVAIVISLRAFERRNGNRVDFAEAYRAFYENHPEA